LRFTADYVVELSGFRALLEVNAARTAARTRPQGPIRSKFDISRAFLPAMGLKS
jgi:hypothetical protein